MQELRKPCAVADISTSNLFSVVYMSFDLRKDDFESAASASSAIPARVVIFRSIAQAFLHLQTDISAAAIKVK